MIPNAYRAIVIERQGECDWVGRILSVFGVTDVFVYPGVQHMETIRIYAIDVIEVVALVLGEQVDCGLVFAQTKVPIRSPNRYDICLRSEYWTLCTTQQKLDNIINIILYQ